MFGSKAAKRERLAQLIDLVATNPGITQAQLARRLSVNRSTILKDLITLSEMGIRLAQDEQGGLYLDR
jgi:predicted DNA-binding transcriptional regulator YafY